MTPIPAATVILVREPTPGTVEVLLMRRHKKSGFMSDAFVFPGGKVDADDAGPEMAAVRELFEEGGVLLARGPLPPAERLVEWRRRLNARETSFGALLREERLEPDLSRLHAWARWVTPSVEPKRFDARFYLAELPPGQTTSFDAHEMVEEAWLTPADALSRHGAASLKLPPPQVRTLHEMAAAGADLAALVAAAAARAPHIAPVMPRFADLGGKMALLLPWDPEYTSRGTGEGLAFAPGQPLGEGPSRFVLDGMSWRLEYAPGAG